MWTSSQQAISPPSPPGHPAARLAPPHTTVAAKDDNCQNVDCRRDNSHSNICRDDNRSSGNGSSTSLASTLWDASRAQEARRLVSSIEGRYTQLFSLLCQLNHYSQNPLGGAMCADYEYKIHQMALFINGEVTKLKRMVGECELRLTRSVSSQSRSSSLAEWEEVCAMSNNDNNNNNNNDNDASKPPSYVDLPPANSLKEIRCRLLNEVSKFFTTELSHIKASLAPVAVQPDTSDR